MASFLLLPYLPGAQLALSSVKRASAPLLRLAFAIALPLTSFALLPRILPSLLSPIYSLLTPCPIFLYANLLILAIVLSSASSPNSFLSHNHSCFPSPRPCHSFDVSDYYLPTKSALQSVPRNGFSLSPPECKKTRHLQPQSPAPGSKLVVSDPRSAPPSGFLPTSCGKLDLVPICSQPTAAKSPAALAQTVSLARDQRANESAFFSRSFQEPQEKKQLAMKQLDQKQHGVAAWTGGRIIRSKSEQRMSDPATPPTRTLRRVETMDEATMVLRSLCDEKLSLSAAMDMPPIESLTDDALNKRCEEFIAKSLAKMRKELLECTE